MISADAFQETLRAELERISSPKHREFLESRFVDPYQKTLAWEYGSGEKYTAWVFADLGEREVVIQYCRGGHGARGYPWGINFRGSDHFGQDTGWYRSLEDLVIDWRGA